MPARRTLERWATNVRFDRCGACGLFEGVVLHHDHLIDAALAVLKHRAGPSNPLVGPIFSLLLPGIESELRFRPCFVCERCNAGDGRGKDPRHGGRGSPLYDRFFSMSPDELRSVRGLTTDRWETVAGSVWREARPVFEARRDTLVALVRAAPVNSTSVREMARSHHRRAMTGGDGL